MRGQSMSNQNPVRLVGETSSKVLIAKLNTERFNLVQDIRIARKKNAELKDEVKFLVRTLYVSVIVNGIFAGVGLFVVLR